MTCSVCGKEMIETNYTKGQWAYKKRSYKKGENVYCSTDCSKEYCRKISSVTMAATNKKYASDRMKKKNPMFRPEVRELVSLKAKGRKFPKRGGNGKPIPVPQKMLFDAIQEYNPVLEYVLRTKKKKDSGYPNHYKTDIALPEYEIAIEVDGHSHNVLARKEQDVKKENFLSDLGWITFRFSNKEILDDLQLCVNKIKNSIRWYYGQ